MFFQNYSREQFTRIVSACFMIGTLLGVNTMEYGLTEENVNDSIIVIVAVVALISDVVGFVIRAFKGDVTMTGWRK